jgi:hypothetical protein
MIKAKALKSNDNQKKIIAKEVNSILGRMDEELKAAHDQGRHSIGIRVPTIFTIPNMSNKDAQRVVYYKILNSLLDREFVVKIQLQENESIFHITWVTEEEEKDIEIQNALIAHYTVSNRNAT